MNAPLEGLLRPPVEYYSAFAYAATSILLVLAPDTVFLLPVIAIPAAIVTAVLSIVRYRSASRIARYHSALKFLPLWEVAPESIPFSNNVLFLGRGFQWTSLHTQRLYDANKPEHAHYREDSPMFTRIRQWELRVEHIAAFKSLSTLTSKSHWGPFPNPYAPRVDLGGYSHIHGVGILEGEIEVPMALGDRVGHTFVAGTTRVGKTRLLTLLAGQDIRRGDCVIVIDPKGDADLLKDLYQTAVAAGRERDFQVFHLGAPEHSVRYNPIGSVSRITEVSTRVARQLPGEGESASFREFVWGYVNAITSASAALGKRSDYRSLETYATDLEPLVVEYLEFCVDNAVRNGAHKTSNWKEIVTATSEETDEKGRPSLRIPRSMDTRKAYTVALLQYTQRTKLMTPVGDTLIGLFSYDPGYYRKLVASLLPFLAKLTTGAIGDLLAPDYHNTSDTRPILDWLSFIRQNGIVYIGLDALSDPDVAAVVGSTMFADLVSTIGTIYKHGYGYGLPGQSGPIKRHVRAHFDEFSDLIGADFVPMVNKGGGTGAVDGGGFSVTAYSQTLSDIEVRMGNAAKTGQVLGNFNNLIFLRVKEVATAEYLTTQLPEVTVLDSMLVTSASDVPDAGSSVMFRSSTEQRVSSRPVPLIQTSDIINLPKGQAFALLRGGQLWKLRLPMPAKSKLALPNYIEELAEQMSRRYRSTTEGFTTRRVWQDIQVVAPTNAFDFGEHQ